MAQHRAKVIITQQLAAQVACLHNQCPSNTEWSGVLVYEVTEGDATKLEEPLTIKAHAVFPMNFGTSGYTEYESDPSMFKLFDQFPNIDPLKKDPKWFIGHIHTHHNMSAFFSGTDKDELLTNVKNLPIYLSLIVNYACAPVAKIAAVAEAETTEVTFFRWKIKGSHKENKKREKKETKFSPAYVIDCDVFYENTEWFIKQLASVKEKGRKPVYSGPPAYNTRHMGFEHWPSRHDKKQEKSQSKKYDKDEWKKDINIHNKVVDHLVDLLTLGQNQHMYSYAALELVNKKVSESEKDAYRKALSCYFCDFWYSVYFEDIKGATEEQVLGSIFEFVNNHPNIAITRLIKQWIYEFKKELPILRKV